MATQIAKENEQRRTTQGQAVTRQQGTSGQGRYAVGLPLTPVDLFRMNPFTLMRRMSEELDRIASEPSGGGTAERAWVPAIEVMQRDGNYVVRAEIPGLTASDVKLQITDDEIVIQGERKFEHEETKGGVHVTERRYGKFYRAIPLPEGAKTDQARANFENGVLEITVPADERQSKPREIPIQGSTSTESSGKQPGTSS